MDVESARRVVDLPIDDILPNRYQPRIKFDDDNIFELAESIKVHGVFQPILVRPIGDKYEIIAGERRYKASVLANKNTIPAIVMSLNDKDAVEIALIENVQRSSLTPIEEAVSYKKILDMGYIKQEDLARKLGKNQSTIANKLRLLNLDEEVQECLQENKISERHARSLLRLKSNIDQRLMVKRIINERLTVRRADEEIDKMIKENNENTTPVVIEDTFENIPSAKVVEENAFENMPSVDASMPEETFNVSPVEEAKEVLDVPSANVEVETQVEVPTQTEDDDLVIPSIEPQNVVIEQTVTPSAVAEVELPPMNDIVPETNSDASIFGFTDDSISAINTQSANQSTVISSSPTEQVENVAIENANIDKIEEEAAPLYQDVPVYSKPELLKPEESIVQEEEEIETPPVFTGKFFNFEPIAEPVEKVEVNDGNSFNFNNFVETEPEKDAEVAPSFEDFFKNQTTTVVSEEEPKPENYTNFQDIAAESVGEDKLVIPNHDTAKDVMGAVNVIREAISKLNSLGYKVDAEEVDLESIYQLMIKIDK